MPIIQPPEISTSIRIIKEQPYQWYRGLRLIKVIAGEIEVRVRARNYTVSEGDFMIFNVGEIHKITAITPNNLVSVTHLNYEFCRSVYKDFQFVVVYVNSVSCEKKHPQRYLALRKRIEKLLNTFYDSKGDTATPQALWTARQFVAYLYKYYDFITCGEGLKRFSKPVADRNRWIYKTYFLREHERRLISLKELADTLGVNYGYFRGDIIERYGIGFKLLQQTVMTESAARLLLETDESVTNISLRCGFSDHKYMIQNFKKFYESTPSEFRRQYKDIPYDSEMYYIEIPIENLLNLMKYMCISDV